jgi:hypothetical protein
LLYLVRRNPAKPLVCLFSISIKRRKIIFSK